MPERAMPAAEIDLTRFAYVAQHRAEALDLSYTQIQRLTGVSRRQISDAMNGKRIGAGATYVLAVVLGIDMDTLLPMETQERLWRIRRLHAENEKQEAWSAETANEKTTPEQAVTPVVTRETRP